MSKVNPFKRSGQEGHQKPVCNLDKIVGSTSSPLDQHKFIFVSQ